MKWYIKRSVFFILILIAVNLYAANLDALSGTVNIDWKTSKSTILDFDNAIFPQEYLGLPLYSNTLNIATLADAEVLVTNVVYKPLQNLSLSNEQTKLLFNTIKVNNYIGISRKNNFFTFTFCPIVVQNGQLQAVSSFNYVVNPKAISTARLLGANNRNYLSNSMLSTGKWYKFGVYQAGVYKLDYSFLKKLGISVDAVNPANIRIFGHRGGMLPELAGADREDDVREIPIKVISANATTFGAADYVLAYLPGPEKWTYNTTKQMFLPQKHLYSDTKDFFITTDNGNGARINTVNASVLPETKTISTYNDYAFLEDDKVNIAHSGRQFLGDEFGGITDKNYHFSMPNLITSQPVKLNIAVVGKSETNGSVFNISTDNATNQYSIFIPNVANNIDIKDAGTFVERQLTLFNILSDFTINLNYNRNGDYNTKGWLDYLQINATSTLKYNGQPLSFRNINSVGIGVISKFIIQNINPNVEVWDVTNPFNIQKINYQLSGNTATFNYATDSLKEFVAVENSSAIPEAMGSISNQNLHALPQQDMLIITRNALWQQAQALAQFHQNNDHLRVAVVDVNQIFNEFSSGNNDITAVRDFVKMFYDRAAGNTADMPKYLLFIGDGSYNNKALGDFLLPTYQSYKTYESLETYSSDDYFGLLDNSEGANVINTATELLDIAVGRIPADEVDKAQAAVDKVKAYYANTAYGDWRNQGTFIADDEDNDIHEADANEIADLYKNAQKNMNIDKIYLDAFQQQSSSGGSTYPAVNDAINKKIFTGTLFFNYVGHGGPAGLAAERVLTVDDISQWTNATKLPLFITATCEFAPYDKDEGYTAGERVLFKQDGGGIALVTTTRVVYSDRNKIMNKNFMQQMVNAYHNETIKLGDIICKAKNLSNTNDGNRKFTLLGDPAIRLAFPKYNIVATKINNQLFTAPHDTLKALSKIKIEGEIQDNNNNLMPNFNGIVSVSIYDKTKSINTLVNDPVTPDNPNGSTPFSFDLQKNIIYKAKVSATSGKFEFTFLVPKDIDYNYGFGKLSLYANSDTTDAAGYNTNVIIGGAYDTLISDNKGPDVDVFMDNDKFVFGGITDETPRIYCKVYDKYGINTSGNGIGHDINAILDKNTKNIYVLNDFYEAKLNDVTHGIINYPLAKLTTGRHTLEVKAWNVLNVSGEGYTEFIVEHKANLALAHVLNYPNPFTTHTRFMFEHNKPGVSLDVKIEIFTVSGKVVKTILKNINTDGYRVDDITWDGLDDYGDKIGKGVYIYRVTLQDDEGKKVSQYQKLVILN